MPWAVGSIAWDAVALDPGAAGLPPSGIAWWWLAGAFLLAELATAHLPFRRRGHTFSASEVPLALGLALASPLALLVGHVAGTGAGLAGHRGQRGAKLLWNLALVAVATTAALLVLVVGAPADGPGLGRLVAAVLVSGLVQGLLTTLGITLAGEALSPDRIGVALGSSLLATSLAGSLGVLAVGLLGDGHTALAALLAVPLGLFAVGLRVASTGLQGARGREVAHHAAAEVRGAAAVDDVAEAVLPLLARELQAGTVELLLWGSGRHPAVVHRNAPDGGVAPAPARSLELLRHKLDLHGAVLQPKRSAGLVRAWLEQCGHEDAIAVPLGPEGESFGALVACDRPGVVDTFTEDDLDLALLVAQAVTGQLDHLRLGDTLDEVMALRSRNDELSRVDDATGLLRRGPFESAVAELADTPRVVVAVRVEGIGDLQDALGVAHARELLSLVASRLRRSVRAGDVLAHLEDATFALVGRLDDDVEVVDRLVRLVRASLLAPYRLADRDVVLAVGIGVSLDIRGAKPADVQLTEAVAAAREAASRPEEPYLTFHDELRGAADRRVTLAAGLHEASRTGDGISALYQPIVDVATGAVVGIEALARWTHPTLGQVSPAEFLPLASRIGVMPELGRALLRRAIDDAADWEVDGALVGLTVNLSAEQLRDPATTATIEQLLDEHHVAHQRLTIDLDASTITHGLDELRQPIEQMSRMGVNIALDDFQIEADVTDVLQQLPVDVIKIPGSLVGSATGRPVDGVLRAMMDLGRELGVGVVVEGLEQAEQLQSLRQFGGAMAQGYLVAPPLTSEAVGVLLRALASRGPGAMAEVVDLHRSGTA